MDRRDFYFKQAVTEGELDGAFDMVEQGLMDFGTDLGFTGVIANGEVTEHDPVADLTVDVAGPLKAYSPLGERIYFAPNQNVDLSVDHLGVSTAVAGGGNEKWVSLFVKFDRLLSDQRVDGSGATVYFRRDASYIFYVVQGAEDTIGNATRPALEADGVLLGEVLLINGQTVINTGDIDTSRRQEVTVAPASAVSVTDNFPNLGAGLTNVQQVLETIVSRSPGASASIDADAAAPAVRPGAVNVASVVRNSIGNYTITFTTPFIDTEYVVMVTPCEDRCWVIAGQPGTGDRTVNAVVVRIINATGLPVGDDLDFDIICFGKTL